MNYRKRTRKYNQRRRMERGKAGFLQLVYNFENTNVLGAGNFGIVLTKGNHAIKLFYNVNACNDLRKEASIQQKCHSLLQNIIHVPKVHEIMSYPIEYKNASYLCGIVMDCVPISDGFSTQLHMVLGYDQGDVDTVWGKKMSEPVGPNNPPRGFHAGQDMMKAVWKDEGINMTIDDSAYIMGRALSTMIQNNIHPFDVEFLYGGNGKMYLVDFGLCRHTNMSRDEFFKNKSSDGLFISYYIPKKGMEGYKTFCEGYWF